MTIAQAASNGSVTMPAIQRKGMRANPKNFRLIEHAVTSYFILVEDTHVYEDLFNPDYWVSLGKRLTTNTLIMARAADGSWTAQLIVASNGETWARVQELWFKKHDAPADKPISDLDLYKIDHVPAGWRVTHRETKQLLISNLKVRDDAERYVQGLMAAKTKN